VSQIITGEVTLGRQIACVQRELRMRQIVFPRQVRAGRMTSESAIREIAEMSAVLETLQSAQAAMTRAERETCICVPDAAACRWPSCRHHVPATGASPS
jgi:hypothetical protein